MISEKEIAAFISGDKSGFDAIYKAYSPGMYAICLRYLRSESDALDALQDTFIKVFEYRKKYDPGQPVGAWIKTITIRTAINQLRSRQRIQLTSDEIDFNVDQDELKQEPETDFKQILQKALDQLPEGYRIVFSLFAIENLTHEEISDYLGISVGASKSQYFKAKKYLQKLLQKNRIAS